jgi:cyclopropane fatty-acyl-phospholipid synthase-like methyltransferase
MEEGQNHLDFGCGWGSLVNFAAKNFGTNSYGITLSEEQAKFGIEKGARMGVQDNVRIMVQDYRTILEDHPEIPKQYDVITCLEMAEHVGIKNFQSFLCQVRTMLKPDGVFYLQIAGLRRAWQYEDLVWGLFMNKYIFPAADASCPLGFVVSQLERAGWEVHRVENTGVHYALTIKSWYYNWIANKDDVIAAYGEYYYRMWIVFLGWSTIIAGQGSSTVFMITNTINHDVDIETSEVGTGVINRTEMWVGDEPIGIQQ